MALVSTRVAEVGGRENRLIVTQAALVMRTYSEEDHLSQMEDVDVTELMTRLAQQQIAYNSVLKSSSMIMQMSLVNFL
jgi:flagellar hook-associated protein 3 FlgL